MDSIVSRLRLQWVKNICVLSCILPPALSAEWRGSFKCHCGNTGEEGTLSKSQHPRFTLEKKTVPPLLLWLKLATFRSGVRHSTNNLVSYLVLWAQSTRKDYIRAEHKLHSISDLFISQVITPQVMFLSLFIFHRYSTRESLSSRVTYFILRAFTETMC